ncbi:unnamed protein product [Coregonus sp. 'balchen']|nr:unnamed protein product [Coregonus sp. 'balchen']
MGVKLGGFRKCAGSDPRDRGAGEAPTMAAVLRELGALHTALSRQALPPILMEQAFRQLTHLLSASALNSLLRRKDMYNVSLLEWLRSRGLQAGGAVAMLEPLTQAAQLLQVGKKTDADAQALVHTCAALVVFKLVLGQPPQLLMDIWHVFPYLPPQTVHADQLDIPDSLKMCYCDGPERKQ